MVVSQCNIHSATIYSEALLEFKDLIIVWTVDDDKDYNKGGVLGLGFFPFVSEKFRNRMIERGCGVRVLAGVVMWETLLLKLCLAFEKGIGRVEQEKKLMAFAVQTTTHSPTGPTSPWMEALVLGT